MKKALKASSWRCVGLEGSRNWLASVRWSLELSWGHTVILTEQHPLSVDALPNTEKIMTSKGDLIFISE
jgi:hypothetical protein